MTAAAVHIVIYDKFSGKERRKKKTEDKSLSSQHTLWRMTNEHPRTDHDEHNYYVTNAYSPEQDEKKFNEGFVRMVVYLYTTTTLSF